MGSHDAGLAMGRMAEVLVAKRTSETSMQLLDQICGPYRNCDAEFAAEDPKRPGHVHPEYDNYTYPQGPLGRLIAEAFGMPSFDYTAGWKSDDLEEQEEACERWFNGPHAAFKKHYDFW